MFLVEDSLLFYIRLINFMFTDALENEIEEIAIKILLRKCKIHDFRHVGLEEIKMSNAVEIIRTATCFGLRMIETKKVTNRE